MSNSLASSQESASRWAVVTYADKQGKYICAQRAHCHHDEYYLFCQRRHFYECIAPRLRDADCSIDMALSIVRSVVIILHLAVFTVSAVFSSGVFWYG